VELNRGVAIDIAAVLVRYGILQGLKPPGHIPQPTPPTVSLRCHPVLRAHPEAKRAYNKQSALLEGGPQSMHTFFERSAKLCDPRPASSDVDISRRESARS